MAGRSGQIFENDETLNLEWCDNSSFGESDTEVVSPRWLRSTTLPGPGDEYATLSINGKIKGSEIPSDNGYGSGGTFNFYRTNISIPSGGKYLRLSKTADGADSQDYTYLYDLRVKMSPPTITSAQAVAATNRNIYNNNSYSDHVSLKLGAVTDLMQGSSTPFGGNGGSPDIVSRAGEIICNASDGKITVFQEGMYEIHVVGQIKETNTGDGLDEFRVIKNSGLISQENLLWTKPEISDAGTYEPSYILHGIVKLNANDFIQLFVNAPGTLNAVRLKAGSTFTILRVG